MSGPRSLALIGARASGKTTVGELLGARLGCDFVDLDAEVARAAGAASAGEYLSGVGESAFRRAETRALCAVARRGGFHVLATGGGTAESARARRVLGARYHCGWLVLDAGEARRRMAAQPGQRPALLGRDPLAEVERLMVQRERHWRSLADWSWDVAGLTPEEVVDRMVAVIRRA